MHEAFIIVTVLFPLPIVAGWFATKLNQKRRNIASTIPCAANFDSCGHSLRLGNSGKKLPMQASLAQRARFEGQAPLVSMTLSLRFRVLAALGSLSTTLLCWAVLVLSLFEQP